MTSFENTPVSPSKIGMRINKEIESANGLLRHLPPAVTIFGGTRVKPDDVCYKATMALARAISEVGVPVFSGGGPGVMEAANRGAREGLRGASVGLNILLPFETPNQHHDLSLMFEHFASRKITFCRHSRAFVCMSGGVGTLDELFECLTLIQTGKMKEVPVILFGREFWSGLMEWLEKAVLARGLISGDDLYRRIQVVDTIDEAMKIIFSESVTAQPDGLI